MRPRRLLEEIRDNAVEGRDEWREAILTLLGRLQGGGAAPAT